MQRASWKRTLPELLPTTNSDGFLSEWHGKMGPCCWGHAEVHNQKQCPIPMHCQQAWKVCGSSSPASSSSAFANAALLLLRLTGVKATSARFSFSVNHKRTERPSQRLYSLHASRGKCVLGQQWSGLVQRGELKTLVLNRLNPPMTVKNAPGPGVRKVDWQPVAIKRLKDRSVILHTNSARSYKLKLSGVVHDSVVQCKKTGTPALQTKIRSAQYEYWDRGDDIWLHAGVLAEQTMAPYFHSKP